MLKVKWWNRGLPKNWWTRRKYSGTDATAEVTLDPWKHFWVCSVTACCLMKVNYFGSAKKKCSLKSDIMWREAGRTFESRGKIRTTTTTTATRTAKNQKQNSNFADWNSLLKMENVELTLVLLGDILEKDKCLHTRKINLRASFPCLLNRRERERVTLILCSIQLLLGFIRGTFLYSVLVNPSTLLKQDAIWAYT